MSPRRAARVLKSVKPASELAVVVIARNEEKHIGKCLDALMQALENRPTTPVLLVDSASTDRTVEIASKYPVDIYRYHGPPYSAAAGRQVGFARTSSRYVLFVDGDCCIEPGWIELALEEMEREHAAAVIYGQRAEIVDSGIPTSARRSVDQDKIYGLGGNALYRSDALRQVRGFNPYLKAGEEAELLGRLVKAGYHALSTKQVMITHYTIPNRTIAGFVARLRRGLYRGDGRTLRLAAAQGLLLYHVRRLNRYLLTLAYLVAGVLSLPAAILIGSAIPVLGWALFGALGFLYLSYRRRSVLDAALIIADWISIALYLPADFVRAPRRPEDFDPVVELLHPRCVEAKAAHYLWI